MISETYRRSLVVSMGCLLLVAVTACRSSQVPWKWLGGGDRERYQVEGSICAQAEEVRDADEILLGVELTFVKAGASCAEDSRRAFVSVGLPKAMKKARRVGIHERVYMTGSLEGRERQVLIVKRLKLQS